MGLRETLNENPRIGTGVTIGIIVLMLGLIFWMSGGAGVAPSSSSAPKQLYFSDDDGKTFFADDALKVPPFDRGGKQAVLAHVYKAGGKTFVNHLERYTPEAKKKVEALNATGSASSDPMAMEVLRQTGVEVKAPGQGTWVKMSDMKRSQEIMRPNPPAGVLLDDLEVVRP